MTNLNVRFFVILKKPPILFIPNNIQAKAGQKLPLKTGQKMNFPPVDKRLYYIYCNQLFRDIFRQAPTCPFFALFPKSRIFIHPSAEADSKRQCFISYPFFNTSSLSGALGSGVDSGLKGLK